ncbi:hypothetical protein D4764_14G0000240 [Takifugu flavidus]|uniref:Uncharacterized protein n=1 Tax=Takifugu flavidus TaxID=433684 RepID=A0A5C6P393_9TELE|nr:hypothetical protein D4764_14G0000240 [Takifugu flavidus]
MASDLEVLILIPAASQAAANRSKSSQPRQPYNIQSLKGLWADLIHPRGLATEEFFNYLGNFSPGDTRAHLQVPGPYFLTGRRVGGIEEVLEVFLPPIHNIPS